METHEEIYRRLRDLRDHLVVRTGRPAEISDGEILMMTSPVPMHGLTAKRIVRQLDAQLAPPLAAFENTDTDDARLGKLRIPDIVVVPEPAMARTTPLDPHDITLAVEIVSRSNPDSDYVKKAADYAAMGIPHYLIVDPAGGPACTSPGSTAREAVPRTANGTPTRTARSSPSGTWSSTPPDSPCTTMPKAGTADPGTPPPIRRPGTRAVPPHPGRRDGRRRGCGVSTSGAGPGCAGRRS